MKLLLTNKDTNLVETIHYFPEQVPELIDKGYLVASIIEPEQIAGKYGMLYYDPLTQKMWYEYQDLPEDSEIVQQSKLEILLKEDLNNKEAIAELYMMTMGGI